MESTKWSKMSICPQAFGGVIIHNVHKQKATQKLRAGNNNTKKWSQKRIDEIFFQLKKIKI